MLLMTAGSTLFVGLTTTNLARLGAIPASGRLGRAVPIDHIVVVYGDDKPAILAQFEASGVEIPQAYKDAAAADPT